MLWPEIETLNLRSHQEDAPLRGAAEQHQRDNPWITAHRAVAQLSGFIILLLYVTAAWPKAQAESPDVELWRQLARTTEISDVAISPDGRWVAWVERRDGGSGELFVEEWRKGGAPTRVEPASNTPHAEASPVWSQDSSRLTFLSDAEETGQNQLWVAEARGRHAQKLTRVKGYVTRPRWSPDGKAIAFLHVEGGTGGGPLGAHESRMGVIEEGIRNQRVAVANAESGDVRLVSPSDLHIYDYDWSPDGQRFAVTAAPGPGDNNWWVAQLYIVDGESGKAVSAYRPKWQIAIPRWSPDGKTIAFIEGLMSDEGFHGGDLHTVPVAGGGPRNHTPGRMASATWLKWLSPSRILFTEYEGGCSGISTLDITNETIKSLWRGPERVTAGGHSASLAVATDGSICALIRHSFEMPPEVWAGTVGDWKQVTQVNVAQKVMWGKAENLEWKSDGLDVQGWLIPPKEVRHGTRYPMVVVVHGGPSGMTSSSWPADIDGALMTKGYFVLLPNPRGSYGRGEIFTQANVKDFGGGDLRDILAGVDTVLSHYPVDPKRLGIYGWSYGGYMTMWAVTQTDRFHAAVAGAGIANWQSYYGQNLIDQWMIPFFGASVYDDPAVYEKSSPIRFITRVKTPTLVVVGERDAECPAPQSFEFWHALKTLGVPTQLVVYPGEGHDLADRANKTDVIKRVLAWFEKYFGI
jgi:dipeptidyl aminopeptidase/acylaminoacyl peptidase